MRKTFKADFKVSKLIEPFPQGEPDYFPLTLGHLFWGRKVSFELYLKAIIPPNEQPQYLSCCSPGTLFQAEWAGQLQEKGINQVYYHRRDQDRVLHFLNRNLRAVLEDGGLPLHEKATWVYDATLIWTRHFFTEGAMRFGSQLGLGLEFVDHLFSCLWEEGQPRIWLLDLCRYDNLLYTHSLNTCLLGMAFTTYLNWPEIKIRAFGLGALLHDIGMINIPHEMLFKAETLSEQEWELVKKHPARGYAILKDFPNTWPETLQMVQQHHENGDGSGYPEGIRLPLIHPWARILRIIDSYEALTADRQWRPKYEPLKALWIMKQDWEQNIIYDANLLANFIRFHSTRD
jgi:HD-GYP domain-containing protein (c-di-GMP phosphodiesterase class II)